MNWLLLKNSLLVSGMTTVLAGSLGFVVALALAGMSPRSRRWMMAGAIAALVLPPFLVANCWLDLLGQNGALHAWLPLKIYSLGGAVWLLTLLHWPVTTWFVLGAWSRLEPSQLESDPALRGPALVRWLLWPMARGVAGQAALLTFVLALNNFAVPVLLQVPVFPEELWLAFTTRLNDAGAWAAAWPMVLAPILLLVCWRRAEVQWPRAEGGASGQALRRQFGRPLRWTCGLFTMTALSLSLIVPMLQLVSARRTWAELPNLFRAAPEVILNSFTYAAAAASLCVVLGLFTWRWRAGLLLWLLFFLPGVLLGRALIFGFQETILYGTATLVMLAFAARYVALGWSGVGLAMRGADRDLIDAARLDGARGWTLLRHAHWPQVAPQLTGVWYVIFLLCLWDVETLVLIQPPGGETLALRIFNLLHYGHHAQANALCLILLALALAPRVLWATIRLVRARC